MCGRFTLKARPEVLVEHFELTEVPGVMPRYNIAPTQAVAVVRAGSEGSRRELSPLRWGLIPSWADDPSIGNRMINARAETAAQKPAYRSAFRLRRCLVLADGFFEWAKTNGAKQPHYFQLKDGGPFAFAGLWERWAKGEEPIESCTLLTTEANEVVSPVHQRMPVLLEPKEYGRWLDPQSAGGWRRSPPSCGPSRPSAWLSIRWGDGSTTRGTMTRGASSRQHNRVATGRAARGPP